jgi:dTDP-glucose 4,6-dehydratase
MTTRDTPRVILVTGAAGFVGHHLVEHLLKNTNDKIIGVDCLNYSGTWDRLRDVQIDAGFFDVIGPPIWTAYDHPRFTPLVWDFRQPAEPNFVKELKSVTHVLHLGAESHVDHSITDPNKFVNSNVMGTVNVLNLARQLPNLELFLYFSTDEVFGPAPMNKEQYVGVYHGGGPFETHPFAGYKETDRHDPKNPYAASKSAGEQFVVAFANTYGIPCVITRQMNVFGERQHPEKFIPLCIKAALDGSKVSIHANKDLTQAGLRHYIHGRNVADAHLFLLNERPFKNSGRNVESYHIVGELEVDNLTLAKLINEYTGIIGETLKIQTIGAALELVDFHSSRPGHDLRYALDGSKMKQLGWEPPKTFHESLQQTIKWTLENQRWLS